MHLQHKHIRALALLIGIPLSLLLACDKQATEPGRPQQRTAEAPVALVDTQDELSDAAVENIVRRSYQYVALYNVIQKFALDPNSGFSAPGFNTPRSVTTLLDHTSRSIARPNNDTLYQGIVLDLRADALIVEYPAIDTKFAVLEVSGYDHYNLIPLASNRGDFKKPVKLLFYTDRTETYDGRLIDGVDQIIKVDGDFTMPFLRAMPHQTDPERMKRIVGALQSVQVETLAEFQGRPAQPTNDQVFPAYGKSDADLYATNLLEVMQFIFNHTSFDSDNTMDQQLLSAFKSLGVEPGRPFNAKTSVRLDGARFSAVAKAVAARALQDMAKPEVIAKSAPQMFGEKGRVDLRTQLIQSVVGPIGLPPSQARYLPLPTADGTVMNAQYDYVLTMSKAELPPSMAFWSVTLYDIEHGFFIPNEQKKYSVGENAGFKLNGDGGIEIHISEKKPPGVPAENWLPFNRADIGMNLLIRIYAPDTEKMKTWKVPQVAQR